MFHLPSETWLDIFKFIDYNGLCNLCLTERFFSKLIDRHKNELALKEFYSFELDRVGHDYRNLWEKAKDIDKDMESKLGRGFFWGFEPDEKLTKKWNTALSENIPMFLPDIFTRSIKAEYVIVITKKERDPYNQRLRLTLPHFPHKIFELVFIRYWLKQLSFCSFKSSFNYCDCYFAIFNPKMLKLIFEENNSSLNFYTKIAGLHIAKNDFEFNKQAIEFISKHLIVTKCLYLCIGNNFKEDIIKFILNFGKKINKISFCNDYINNAHSALIDIIIEIILNSTNCLEIVKDIEITRINNLIVPNLLNKVIKSEEGFNEEEHFFKKYLIRNNQNNYFYIYFSHPTETGKFDYFRIYQTFTN